MSRVKEHRDAAGNNEADGDHGNHREAGQTDHHRHDTLLTRPRLPDRL